MMNKKAAAVAVLSVIFLSACGGSRQDKITVVSREEGSGTRGAFVELFQIEEKNESGERFDLTTEEAEITNSTAVMLSSVSGNKSAIGYLSMGSLNDTVKALDIDGSAATTDHIKSELYKISRPFLAVTGTHTSDVSKDFMSFIRSEDGQRIVEENHYISQGSTGSYKGSGLTGKIVVGGSSSVTPVMEKLKEAYTVMNPAVNIEIQQSDSTTGVTSLAERLCDIGMASRALKDSEKQLGLNAEVIALDGIAVIVNKENPVNGMSSQTVRDIFTGTVTGWDDIQ